MAESFPTETPRSILLESVGKTRPRSNCAGGGQNGMTVQTDGKEWFASKAGDFLRRAGLAEGQRVLDFGSNRGNYVRPAAKIVGARGRVYAVDKDCDVLDELKRAVSEKKLSNVECLFISEDGEIPLPPCSIDIALLYDVLHPGYFPKMAQRKRILQNIHGVLRPDGLLSLYPTHLRQYAITFDSIIRETEAVGFELCGESRRAIVHDDKVVRGRVFSFRRVQDCERHFNLPEMPGDN